jgi:hypothetical protein
MIADQIIYRKHVDDDLMPYVCISEKCCEHIQTFSTFRSWYGHIISQHGLLWHQEAHPSSSWVCPVCQDRTDHFKTAGDLYIHMQATHPFSETQLEAIVHMSRILVRRRPDVCPLCCLRVEDDEVTQAKSKRAPELDATKQAADLGKRHQEPPVSESVPKRLRQRQTGSDPPVTMETANGRLETITEGNDKKARVELMARHVAAHLQTLMSLTIRLLELRDSAGDVSSSASSLADTGDNSTWNISSELYDESHGSVVDGDTLDLGLVIEDTMSDKGKTPDLSDNIPDSKVEVNWSAVKSW